MNLPQAQGHARVPLAAAQAAFRQAPSRATALAYMDAAIEEYEALDTYAEVGSDASHRTFSGRMREIRDWLMNVPEPSSDLARMVLCQGV